MNKIANSYCLQINFHSFSDAAHEFGTTLGSLRDLDHNLDQFALEYEVACRLLLPTSPQVC